MKPLAASAALAVLLTAALPGQDLPPWVLLLARVKQHARSSFERIPDYACLETVNRFERPRDGVPYRSIDTLHLEVVSVGGKELLARQGAARFQDGDATDLISYGLIGSGDFSVTPLNLFVHDAGRMTVPSEAGLPGQMGLRFDFELSGLSGAYLVQARGVKAVVGLRGTFWVDPQTLDLVRLEEHAVDLPPNLLMLDIATSIEYARVRIGASDALLPRSAETVVTDMSGSQQKNAIEFTGCREYRSESTIHFGVSVPQPPPPAPAPPRFR